MMPTRQKTRKIVFISCRQYIVQVLCTYDVHSFTTKPSIVSEISSTFNSSKRPSSQQHNNSGGRSSNTLTLHLRLGAAFLFVLYSLRRTRFILACAALAGGEIGVALHHHVKQRQQNKRHLPFHPFPRGVQPHALSQISISNNFPSVCLLLAVVNT